MEKYKMPVSMRAKRFYVDECSLCENCKVDVVTKQLSCVHGYDMTKKCEHCSYLSHDKIAERMEILCEIAP